MFTCCLCRSTFEPRETLSDLVELVNAQPRNDIPPPEVSSATLTTKLACGACMTAHGYSPGSCGVVLQAGAQNVLLAVDLVTFKCKLCCETTTRIPQRHVDDLVLQTNDWLETHRPGHPPVDAKWVAANWLCTACGATCDTAETFDVQD